MSRILRALGVVLALCAAVGLAAYLTLSIHSSRELAAARRDNEKIFGKVDLGSLAPPELPADDNAATWLTAGANAVVATSKNTLLTRLARMPDDEWPDDDRETAAEILAANQPALTLLERASQCSGSSFGIAYEQGAYAEVPDFLALLRAYRLVAIRARTRFAAGEIAAFRADLALMSRFADALSRESLVVSSMVVLTLDLDYLDVLHEALSAGIDDSLWLEEVLFTLENMNRRDLVWRALRAESAVAGSLATAVIEDEMPAELDRVIDLTTIKGSPFDLPRLFDRPAARLLHSDFLRAPTEAADWIDKPSGHWFQSPEPGPEPLRWAGSPGPQPQFMSLIGRLQAGETARLLALEAVRLSHARSKGGSYPAESQLPVADPLAAAPCRRSTAEDGGPVLECPVVLELFESSVGNGRVESANLFSWRLPG